MFRISGNRMSGLSGLPRLSRLPPCHGLREEALPVFGSKETVVPANIDEIDDYLISTMKCSVEEKREIFSTINVDYDKVKKFYPIVTKLERDYNISNSPSIFSWFKKNKM